MDLDILNSMSLNAPAIIIFLIFASVFSGVIIRIYEPIKNIISGLGDFVSSIWELIEDHI